MKLESSVGKRVGGALYIHKDAARWASAEILDMIAKAEKISSLTMDDYTVVKLQPDRVSLLEYEDFDTSAFPALLKAHTVDLSSSTARMTDHSRSINPPILHRKELLLKPDDPRRQKFAKLTRTLEERGLFENSKTIGRKRQWEERLEKARASIVDHDAQFESDQVSQRSAALDQGTSISDEAVARHKTAIIRNNLSAPMQALARHGLLDDDVSVFDYGCGQGDDVEALKASGISASGWDPHYRPNEPKAAAAIVNLGFVVNVIEDPAERKDVIRSAFDLATTALCISVMVWGKGNTDGQRSYRDGFLTRLGTFQKYYSQAEIKALVENILGQDAIALAPGILLVFRDKLAEQEFLVERHRTRRDISHLLGFQRFRAPKEKQDRDTRLLEQHGELVAKIWNKALNLGRIPDPSELGTTLYDQVKENLRSIRTAVRLGTMLDSAEALESATKSRVEDLKVYFALNFFSQRKPYRALPLSLQRDIKSFFSSQKNALEAAKTVLFSIGDSENIRHACQDAASQGLGYLNDNHSLQIDSKLLERLPTILRIYVGCSEILYGDISNADILKIHIGSGKITLLTCDEYDSSPIPKIIERVKISMREQSIDIFSYGDQYPPPNLYLKSRFIAPDHKNYEEQLSFDNQLQNIARLDLSFHGPSASVFDQNLKKAGLRIEGFKLVSGS